MANRIKHLQNDVPKQSHIDFVKGIIYYIENEHDGDGMYGNPYSLSLYRIWTKEKEVHLLNGSTDKRYHKLAKAFRYLGYSIHDSREIKK